MKTDGAFVCCVLGEGLLLVLDVVLGHKHYVTFLIICLTTSPTRNVIPSRNQTLLALEKKDGMFTLCFTLVVHAG